MIVIESGLVASVGSVESRVSVFAVKSRKIRLAGVTVYERGPHRVIPSIAP